MFLSFRAVLVAAVLSLGFSQSASAEICLGNDGGQARYIGRDADNILLHGSYISTTYIGSALSVWWAMIGFDMDGNGYPEFYSCYVAYPDSKTCNADVWFGDYPACK
jgi:hypothetical protein